MKIIKVNGHVLEMYDSVQELPVTRFQHYNLNLLIDAGIGSDITGFDNRLNTAIRLMKNDPEAAAVELQNLSQNVRFIMSKTSPELNSFVAMIHKINGRPLNDDDMTEEGIRAIIKDLGRKRVSNSVVKNFLNYVKKKSTLNLNFSSLRLGTVRKRNNSIRN